MFVTYIPEDSPADKQEWEFRPGKLRESQAERIEKRYARLLGEKSVALEQFRMGVLQQQASARRVLLWHLLSLDHPTIRIEDVDPIRDEVEVEASKAELEDLRSAVLAMTGLDEMQRDLMVASVDSQILEARGDGSGKALSRNSESVTG